MGACYLAGRRVGDDDFRNAYDRVAPTYDQWQARMGRHTLRILEGDLPERAGEPLRILDLACGTGYLTQELVRRLEGAGRPAFAITGVDLSPAMLARCRAGLDDTRDALVEAEGLRFLEGCLPGSFDAVFCGWGMVYFPHHRLVRLLHRVLAPGGTVGAIMNCRGTLSGIEVLFIRTMSEHPQAVRKVMETRFRLPSGERQFRSWFTRHGFERIASGSGEEVVSFHTAGHCLRWLRETGALAGPEALFEDPAAIEPALVAGLARAEGGGPAFRMNHRFVYGIFRRGGQCGGYGK